MMAKVGVHIIGDAFLDHFVAVQLKTDTTEKADAPVYELNSAVLTRQTESPGGAALLATLLAPHVSSLAVSIPATASSELQKRLAKCRTKDEAAITVTLLPCAKTQSRITHYYTRNNPAEDRWQLVFRCDAIFPPPSSPLNQIPQTNDVLIIDDHGRGAITEDLLNRAVDLQPSQTILSAQHENLGKYLPILSKSKDVILVCSERQALLWVAEDAPPVRLPSGRPQDQLALLQFIYARLRNAFPNVKNIIVTRSSSTYSCLHFYENNNEQFLRSYEGTSSSSTSTSHQVPGINTVFLAALARAVIGGSDLPKSLSEAVNAAMAFAENGVQMHETSFGRSELLSSADNAPLRVETNVFKEVSEAAWSSSEDFLRWAQLYGRFPARHSPLPGYYIPARFEKTIESLLAALEGFVTRPTSNRPFNILISAEPGSGKSYFAQCLSRELAARSAKAGTGFSRHPLVETNLSVAEGIEKAEATLHDMYSDIRDQRALGKVPIVLLDEFDSFLHVQSTGQSATPDVMDQLFARLLVPLWDGAFTVNGRYRRLGGFVLLVVVSTAKFAERLKVGEGKARDFSTRIDVRLRLPSLGEFEENERFEAQARIAVAMIKKHFGSQVARVELAALDAVARAQFSGKNRGIDQLIMMSRTPEAGIFRISDLPSTNIIDSNTVSDFHIDISERRYGQAWVEID